ncbi:MAG TPA: NRDE family protein [Bryobacteraceae bacterium]|nr:NRDE family protein [Bryobacteraceae bacterium]
MSWVHRDGGFDLLCNRDEKHTRARAADPRVASRDGVQYVAPVDGECGGTWISVNEFGVAICLLNGGAGRSGRASRGHVVTALADSHCVDEAAQRLIVMDLEAFAPFVIAVIAPGKSAVIDWDGEQYRVDPHPEDRVPLISSSFDPDAVRDRRRVEFERRVATTVNVESLYSFHLSHGQQRGPYSTCMHRADAQSVSFSWVKVGGGGIDFLYSPDAPCRRTPFVSQSLPRRCV